ncbi:hypothetical protein [Miltoncostaea marina]|uniref:flagellar biosynthesis protein FlhF n=1 Tax=Miltoncostaea marina TaxID=2843215 RepID=UPI001C3C45B8|nr:hypothetical protein [Miltoncostaea marina]
MQIKQFSGATIDDVLTQVRAELGEEAVILQTKRVVTGGIGGFFGRAGVEVTAAKGLPADEGERANREAAASVAVAEAPAAPAAGEAPAPPSLDVTDEGDEAEPAEPFARHLDGRLAAAQEAEDLMPPLGAAPASPAATYARAGGGAAAPAPRAPFEPGGEERARAIMQAARAAVRDAHDHAVAPAEAFEVAPGPARRRTPASADLEPVRAELARAGVDERFLEPFLERFELSVVPFLDGAPVREAVRGHLAERLPLARGWKPRAGGHTLAFVGQSGVGKTTAAAGLAARYRAAGLSVALVAAGPGSHDALAAHAHRLDVQLFSARDGAALATLRGTLADRDLVIIDTAGRSCRQADAVAGLGALLGPVRADEVHLVLPLASHLADLGDLQRAFRGAGVNRLTLTKLDETRLAGNLMNVPLRMGSPLAYLSDGVDVPGALAPADGRRIARMLLP